MARSSLPVVVVGAAICTPPPSTVIWTVFLRRLLRRTRYSMVVSPKRMWSRSVNAGSFVGRVRRFGSPIRPGVLPSCDAFNRMRKPEPATMPLLDWPMRLEQGREAEPDRQANRSALGGWEARRQEPAVHLTIAAVAPWRYPSTMSPYRLHRSHLPRGERFMAGGAAFRGNDGRGPRQQWVLYDCGGSLASPCPGEDSVSRERRSCFTAG